MYKEAERILKEKKRILNDMQNSFISAKQKELEKAATKMIKSLKLPYYCDEVNISIKKGQYEKKGELLYLIITLKIGYCGNGKALGSEKREIELCLGDNVKIKEIKRKFSRAEILKETFTYESCNINVKELIGGLEISISI